MPINVLTDSEWVKNSFMVPTYALDETEEKSRILTDAIYKFTDTSMGGNMVMNPAPQFTRFADIKVLGRYAAHVGGIDGSRGLGRYYSEAIDDNKQVIHLRFGVPAFNSMTQFFTSFYDPAAGYLANTGRTSPAFFNVGRFIGFVVSLTLLPIVLVGTAINRIWNYFAGTPNSKYYYLKPAMPLYWNAVNSMANTIAANMGVVPRMQLKGTSRSSDENALNESTLASYYNMNPNIYKPEGGIDIYRISNRAQRLADAHRAGLSEVLSNDVGDTQSWFQRNGDVNKVLRDNLKAFLDSKMADASVTSVNVKSTKDGSVQVVNAENLSDDDLKNLGTSREALSVNKTISGLDAYMEIFLNSEFGKLKPSNATENGSWWGTKKEEFDELFLAEARDGSQFVSFKVDFQGSVSESFSNNSKESDLQSQINGMASGARSKRFNFADGNIGDGPIAGMLEGIASAAKDVVSGIADSLQMSGLMALSGRGLVDIPKYWESSSCSLPRMDYTIELRSPYGNKMSMFQNIYVPLAMLLAGALPLSTGKQSYTSPFLVEVHSKGRISCRLGLIESMSITRGVGNLAWTDNDEPLGIDVSFTIADLSTIMHMPINPGQSTLQNIAEGAVVGTANALFGDAAGDGVLSALAFTDSRNFDEDNTFTDYMSVLGSLGIDDMIYGTNKLKLRATQRMLEFKSWYSMGHFAQWTRGTFLGRQLSNFAQQGSRDNQ